MTRTTELNVVLDQEVAVFSSRGTFQSFYRISAISPKGTVISMVRGDGYSRCFNNNNVERNSSKSSYNSDYVRTDVDQVRLENTRKVEILKVLGMMDSINVPSLSTHVHPTELVKILTDLETRIAQAKQLAMTIS